MSILLYYGIYLIIYVVCYTIVMLDIYYRNDNANWPNIKPVSVLLMSMIIVQLICPG